MNYSNHFHFLRDNDSQFISNILSDKILSSLILLFLNETIKGNFSPEYQFSRILIIFLLPPDTKAHLFVGYLKAHRKTTRATYSSGLLTFGDRKHIEKITKPIISLGKRYRF